LITKSDVDPFHDGLAVKSPSVNASAICPGHGWMPDARRKMVANVFDLNPGSGLIDILEELYIVERVNN
jgi:hypothetical protein